MTDKPTPTTDLLKRCAEIHEWRSTGVLSGEALRDYAKRKWPDRHDTLQMAEHETVTEALALLAKWGQPAAEPSRFGSPELQAMTIARCVEKDQADSGFDHKTAADFLSGKTISDEAVRKFVAASRWAHDERAALSATLLAMHGVLTSREAEIALLKKALLEAEAAPQQDAQEPVAYVHVPHYPVEGKVRPVVSFEKYQQDYADGIYSTRIPLYTAPQPAPAPLSEMPYEKRKAIQEGEQIGASDAWFKARHEMLDTVDRRNVFRAGFDRGWSAAIAAQGGKA